MEFSGQYLTYVEYKALGGTLDQLPFNLLEFNARKEIDKYTFGRLINLDEQEQETKLCTYKLINTLEAYLETESASNTISSESIDGYSIKYNDYRTLAAIQAKEGEIKSIIKDYLFNCKLDDGTPYLYKGVE